MGGDGSTLCAHAVKNNPVVLIHRHDGKKPPAPAQASDSPHSPVLEGGAESLRAASAVGKDCRISTVFCTGTRLSWSCRTRSLLSRTLLPQNPVPHSAKTRLCDGNGEVLFFSNNNNNNDNKLKKLLHINSTLKPYRPQHSSISSVDFLRFFASGSCHL